MNMIMKSCLTFTTRFADINGFLPHHVAFDMVHNRTANVTGKRGHNNGLDLTCEHLNNAFKSR